MINDVALFMNRPKISVVTVCFNAVETIESTIKSVIQQTYDNIEYIIIDGASTDGTLDIINNYNDRIACCLSEPDKGIYDAMNKGIKMATGEWINFMNSGDMFYKNSVLSEVALKLKDGDIIYGDTMLSFSVGSKLKKPYPLEEIVDRMVLAIRQLLCEQIIIKNICLIFFIDLRRIITFLERHILQGPYLCIIQSL